MSAASNVRPKNTADVKVVYECLSCKKNCGKWGNCLAHMRECCPELIKNKAGLQARCCIDSHCAEFPWKGKPVTPNNYVAHDGELYPLDQQHFCAAGALLWRPGNSMREAAMLLAVERRLPNGSRPIDGGARHEAVERYNFLGGKRHRVVETPRAVAARKCWEETGGLLSTSARSHLADASAPVVFGSRQKYALFFHELGAEDADLAERLAAQGGQPNVDLDADLLRVEWVPLRRLLEARWRETSLYPFANDQAIAALPVVSQLLQRQDAECDVSDSVAPGAAGDALAPQLAAMAVEERRCAPDGMLYTRQEFVTFFGGLDEWHSAAAMEPVARAKSFKQGQRFRCPECAAQFDCATTKWGMFLNHVKTDHPGVAPPKRNDAGVILELDAAGNVMRGHLKKNGDKRRTPRSATNEQDWVALRS